MKNIINLIQFVRGCEPRPDRCIDLYRPVEGMLSLLEKHSLHGTFLIQYDALIDPRFREIFEKAGEHDLGLWFEVVQPLVEAVGLTWHGRYPWDWYNDVGFLIGYQPRERIALIDEAMNRFFRVFGRYPESVGSWHMDAVSLAYLEERYHVRAACMCRDQVGIDGYTLQGGYYNQAFYPSRSNMFCPAGTAEEQISVPVFRMLGTDPVREYDRQQCLTLEPAQAGGNPDWCRWFFRENFSGSGLAFQYAQVGQENSFGWEAMEKGLTSQVEMVDALAREGKAEVLTLAEAGKWFTARFPLTPASSQSFSSGYQEEGLRSVWYNCRFYRANLFLENGVARFRDIYRFDSRLEEAYLHTRCTTNSCEYRNLPVMDGYLYSTPECKAGLYLCDSNGPVHWDSWEYSEEGGTASVLLKRGGDCLRVTFRETGVTLTGLAGLWLETKGLSPLPATEGLHCVTEISVMPDGIAFTFGGLTYHLRIRNGYAEKDFSLHADENEMTLLTD